MSDLTVRLPDESEITGGDPIVIVGPNGSGKTRLSRQFATGASIEYINALRNTRISAQLPVMSKSQAVQQHDGMRNTVRQQPWELASDFDFALAQLLADDGDAARGYRKAHKSGGAVEAIGPTPLERVEELWKWIFPGRTLEWQDWSPVVTNDLHGVTTYSANQMSDGERAALYLLSKVLLAAAGSVLVIDEPETHFHSELAVRFWDALERERSDLRFIYATHDLPFALSREPATYLLADPLNGLKRVEVDSELPAEIRRDILGAASFSYYASRVVFCEGEDHSYDKAFFTAWFGGRDTVVKAVGSGEAVRACVTALMQADLVPNLEAVGIVDRDFRSDEQLAAFPEAVTVLPVHEIEGIVCIPEIAMRIASHLATNLDHGVEEVIRQSITDADVRRVAYERTKVRLRNVVENVVSVKPDEWDQDALDAYYGRVNDAVSASLDAVAIWKEELEKAEVVRSTTNVNEILALFPSRSIASRVASALGVNVSKLFELLNSALHAPADDPLYALGKDLERALGEKGLPRRVVEERTLPAPALSA